MTETPTTMGSYLRAARRKRRISLERAAEDTRVRPEYLMRMESDEFDFLAPAYVRGFLKTYARFLRVDPEPLLEEFDRRYGGRVDTPVAPIRRSKEPAQPRKRISPWVWAAGVAVVVLSLLAIIGMNSEPEPDENPTRVTLEDGEKKRKTPKPTPSDEPTPTESPTVTPTPTPSSTEIAFDQGIELTVKSVSHDVWVGVEADGQDAPGVTLRPGEEQTFTAQQTMGVVLGYADGIELFVNGQSIGSPGIPGPFTFELPEDIETLI